MFLFLFKRYFNIDENKKSNKEKTTISNRVKFLTRINLFTTTYITIRAITILFLLIIFVLTICFFS